MHSLGILFLSMLAITWRNRVNKAKWVNSTATCVQYPKQSPSQGGFLRGRVIYSFQNFMENVNQTALLKPEANLIVLTQTNKKNPHTNKPKPHHQNSQHFILQDVFCWFNSQQRNNVSSMCLYIPSMCLSIERLRRVLSYLLLKHSPARCFPKIFWVQ